ncbi:MULTISPECIES: DUF397 domain-containing protein [unclassified Streptomyces]|uniref:DUF397 domain-containing protein n=1 Tax=unclassified Streptomyces TaxID=2593676 RepID=UPI00081DA444|nr:MULTISPECIES: DUF397 domain-containing protein [unclassified Streptomyces]MYZ35443.1 DUF397 domain-containing protein [Streptomyces sp. SID4917]SCF75510.1 protein of unknown function [Streptomyces sp. MnatMP-M17]
MTITADALTGADWFKSSYSNDNNGNCVEGARLARRTMAVRDSKAPQGPALVLTGTAWTAFVRALGDEEFAAQ